MSWIQAILNYNACEDALEWCGTQPDAETAWAKCERADWMLWIAARVATTDAKRKAVVLAACACARTALRFVPAGEDRPRIAIETAERWCKGEASIEEVRKAHGASSAAYASDAAYAYASSAASASAASAAYAAAASAAYAADASASSAAYAYAYAAYASAAAYAARQKALREMADIVRAILPMPVLR